MYTPKDFKVEDTREAHALMRAHPFAILVTQGTDGIVATHLPTVLKIDDGGGLGRIECHLARPNPQWRTFAGDAEALIIYQGADAYIRPGWYPSKREHGKVVPTWNYAVVHLHGRLEAIEDAGWLRGLVERLTTRHEAARTQPWAVGDAPADYIEQMLKAIVGIRIQITRVQAKWKLGQNRSAADRAGVAQGLAAQGADAGMGAMAKLVSG
jgi:transcriptional regulator